MPDLATCRCVQIRQLQPDLKLLTCDSAKYLNDSPACSRQMELTGGPAVPGWFRRAEGVEIARRGFCLRQGTPVGRLKSRAGVDNGEELRRWHTGFQKHVLAP